MPRAINHRLATPPAPLPQPRPSRPLYSGRGGGDSAQRRSRRDERCSACPASRPAMDLRALALLAFALAIVSLSEGK